MRDTSATIAIPLRRTDVVAALSLRGGQFGQWCPSRDWCAAGHESLRRHLIRASLRTSAGTRDRQGVRTYEPVEIRYLPPEVSAPRLFDDIDPDDPNHQVIRTEIHDQTDAIVDAIRELDLGLDRQRGTSIKRRIAHVARR